MFSPAGVIQRPPQTELCKRRQATFRTLPGPFQVNRKWPTVNVSAAGRSSPMLMSLEDRPRHFRYRVLHVVSISDLRQLAVSEVLHDFADLASTTESDRILPVELRVVPVHFCQCK